MPVDDVPSARPAAQQPTVIGGARRSRQEAARLAEPGAPRRSVRVALLDDHEVLLDGMASWIRANAPDFDVVLTATSWLQLVHSSSFPTDLVIDDMQLRERVSIEARIRTCRAAGAKVVVLTGQDTPELRDRAARAGASALLAKGQPLAEVMAVAREVLHMTGDGTLHREWRPLPAAAAATLQKPKLSLGEEAALRLYVSGKSTSEVAAAMHVQFETAKTYLRRVREKYARVQRPASRKAELLQRATEDGLLDER